MSKIKAAPQKKREKVRPGLGAPSIEYTDEMGEYICELVATSTTSLEEICKQNPNIPCADTIYVWRLRNRLFAEMYLEAKRQQSFLYAAETMRIADDTSQDYYTDSEGNLKPNTVAVSRHALMIKTRQWHAARLLPKVFGDRPDDLVQKVAEQQVTIERLNKLAELQAKHDKEY